MSEIMSIEPMQAPTSPVMAFGYHPVMIERVAALVRGIGQDSVRNCGCSWEVHLANFSYRIDMILARLNNQAIKEIFLFFARENNYMLPDEVREMQQKLLDSGLCIHGIDPDCCPAGCGEY